MEEFILILGGARSGKSRYAVALAKRLNEKVAFVATAVSPDEEMEERIKLHRALRPRRWRLIEEGKDVSSILSKLKSKYKVVILDCIGLLISNLLEDDLNDKEIQMRIKKLITAVYKSSFTTIVVSNEVGSGVVPQNPLARRFRDLLGLANQLLAMNADKVIFMQSGIPVVIKGGKFDEKIK